MPGTLQHRGLLEREAELRALTDACAQADAGRSAVVVVRGPAGCGRTALLRELVGRRRGGCVTSRGPALERGFAFAAVLRLLQPRPGGVAPVDDATPAVVRELLRTGRTPEAGEHASAVAGCVDLLAAAAARAPLAAVVDDLQDCDAASVEVLSAAARRRIPGLALVLAVRDGTDLPPALPATVRLRPAPLSVDAVTRMAPDGYHDAGALHRHTAGNPLLVRALLDAGAGPRDPVPADLVRTVRTRLDDGPGDVAAVAEALAVLGHDAGPTLVAVVAGLGTDAVDGALGRLRAEGILGSTGALRPRALREAVLAALSLPRAATLRLRAARALATADPVRAAEHVLLAAPDPAAREAWAIDVVLRGAGLAGERSDERLALLEHALGSALDPGTHARTRAALGATLVRRDVPAGAEQLRRAQALAPDPAAAAAIAVDRAEALFHLARMDESARVAREALATPAGENREVRLRLEAAALAAEAARGDVATPTIPQALLEGPARTLGERAVLSRLAWALATTGTVAVDEVRALARRAMGGTALLDAAGVSSPAFVYAASALVIAGETEEVVQLTGEAARRARHDDAPIAVAYALALRGQALIARGRLLEAAADAETALDELGSGDLPALAVAMAWRVETAVDLGDLRGARDALAARGLDGELADLGHVHLLLLARAGLRAAGGDLGEARADLELLRRRVGAGYANPSSLAWKPRLAEVLHATGDREGARDLVAGAVERAERFGEPRGLAACLRVRGRLRGDADGLADLRRAAALLEPDGATPARARVLLDLGSATHGSGDPGARAILREGLLAAHGAGAVALVDDALRRLRDAGARPRRPRVPGTHALRPQRRQVIELAAAGLDDEEIGDRLFLRRETVTAHVAGGLRTLGLADRAALRAAPPS